MRKRMRQRDRNSSKSHKDIQNHKYRQTERDTQRQRERHKGTQAQRKKDCHLKTTVSLSSEHSLQLASWAQCSCRSKFPGTDNAVRAVPDSVPVSCRLPPEPLLTENACVRRNVCDLAPSGADETHKAADCQLQPADETSNRSFARPS